MKIDDRITQRSFAPIEIVVRVETQEEMNSLFILGGLDLSVPEDAQRNGAKYSVVQDFLKGLRRATSKYQSA